jgi:hypothetical protein
MSFHVTLYAAVTFVALFAPVLYITYLGYQDDTHSPNSIRDADADADS